MWIGDGYRAKMEEKQEEEEEKRATTTTTTVFFNRLVITINESIDD